MKLVYQNQENDVHPPLYYFLINISMSFASGICSKWTGILPNMFFSILTSLFLFKITKKLTKNDALSLLCTAFFAFSIGNISSVVFIRMYALLTLWVTAFTYYHLVAFQSILQDKMDKKNYAFLCIVTCGGLLTHYYFLIVCLFFCGGFWFFLLSQKKIKALLYYTMIELSALIACIAFFPKMLYHLFSGDRGTQAIANFTNPAEGLENLFIVLSILNKDLFAGLSPAFLFCAIICCAVIMLRTLHTKQNSFSTGTKPHTTEHKTIFSISANTWFVGYICIAVSAYICIVARIAPYKTNRYYMCLYPLLVLCVVYGVYIILKQLLNSEKAQLVFASVLFTSLTIASYLLCNVSYLYQTVTERPAIPENYKTLPMIVLYGYGTDKILPYLPELTEYGDLYLLLDNALEDLTQCNTDGRLNAGFLFYSTNINLLPEEAAYLLDTHLNACTQIELKDNLYYCTLENSL